MAQGMPWSVASTVRKGNYPVLVIASVGVNNQRTQLCAMGSTIRDTAGTSIVLQMPIHLSLLAPRVVARDESGTVPTQLIVSARCHVAGIEFTPAAEVQLTLTATNNPPLDEPWLRFEGSCVHHYLIRAQHPVNALEAEYVFVVPQLQATFGGYFRTIVVPG